MREIETPRKIELSHKILGGELMTKRRVTIHNYYKKPPKPPKPPAHMYVPTQEEEYEKWVRSHRPPVSRRKRGR